MNMTEIEELIDGIEEPILKMDGYDDCVLGLAHRFGMDMVIAYDQSKVIRRLMEDGMDYDEAMEFHQFNQLGAYAEGCPVFIDTGYEEDECEEDTKPYIIGVAGRAGSGKDPAAQAIIGQARAYAEKFALAKGLKDMQAAFYGVHQDDPMLYTAKGKASPSPRPMNPGNTVRDDLIQLGDATRAVNQDIWVNHTLDRIKRAGVKIAAISDVRYPNEMKVCNITVWIGEDTPGSHPTEAALSSKDVDGPIFNQPNVDDRLAAVREWAAGFFDQESPTHE